MEMISAMLLSANLPLVFWGEAVNTTCYITNRILHKILDMIPYEMWKNRKPQNL